MKKTLLLLSIIVSLTSCMSIKPLQVEIEPTVQIIQVDLNKNDAWVKANNWMVKVFNSAESVIQFTDKEAGIINGKYTLYTLSAQNTGFLTREITASVIVQAKDNAVRISVDPEDYTIIDSESSLYARNRYTKEKAKLDIDALILSFENYMKNDATTDW